jgi:RND family efflux transporter MFP subunit
MQWLHWFREMLPESGWLVLYSGADLACHAQWPSKISLSCELPNIAAQAIARREPCQCVLPEDESQDVLAIPFFFADEQIAVLVIDSQCLTTKQKQSSVRLADWASHWLQVSGNDDETVIPADDFLDLSNQIMTDFEQRANIDSACFVMVNKVADFLDSSRVSVAEVVNGKPRLLAVSGQSKIDSRRNSSQQLIHALQEVVSNARPTEYTEINPSTELPAHHQLHLTNGGCSVFGLLHAASGKPASIALLIEQPDLKTTGCIVNVHDAQLREAMALLGVLLHSHRSMHRRLSDQAHALLASVREKRFFDKHLLVFVCGLLAITAFLLPVPHRVTVKAMIDASDRQVLVAPQAGYILSAHARAGDKVVAGSLLATLDDQDLQLVVAKWQGERQKNRQEYAKALAQHNRIELSRLRADVLRIDAELALAEQQLKRSEIRAPFDGVLLSGDLSQSLGSPVEQGAVLFEIGSTDTYRLTMDVNEHDIAYISEGQTAKIRMTALPGQNWQARLETVLPVAIAQQGESVFRVPADVLGDAQALRPGMAGVGKVSVGSRSLIWVVTHAITDRMRILAWKLGLIR